MNEIATHQRAPLILHQPIDQVIVHARGRAQPLIPILPSEQQYILQNLLALAILLKLFDFASFGCPPRTPSSCGHSGSASFAAVALCVVLP